VYRQDILYSVILNGKGLDHEKFQPLADLVFAVCAENIPEGSRFEPEIWESRSVENGEWNHGWMVRGIVPRSKFSDLRKALGGCLIAQDLMGVVDIRVDQFREGSHMYLIHGADEDVYTMNTGRM
jgi:hypothetical protein